MGRMGEALRWTRDSILFLFPDVPHQSLLPLPHYMSPTASMLTLPKPSREKRVLPTPLHFQKIWGRQK